MITSVESIAGRSVLNTGFVRYSHLVKPAFQRLYTLLHHPSNRDLSNSIAEFEATSCVFVIA